MLKDNIHLLALGPCGILKEADAFKSNICLLRDLFPWSFLLNKSNHNITNWRNRGVPPREKCYISRGCHTGLAWSSKDRRMTRSRSGGTEIRGQNIKVKKKMYVNMGKLSFERVKPWLRPLPLIPILCCWDGSWALGKRLSTLSKDDARPARELMEKSGHVWSAHAKMDLLWKPTNSTSCLFPKKTDLSLRD